MNTLQIVLLVAVGLSLVGGFIMKMPSASRRDARKLLAATPWLADDSADGAPVKISGVVKMREHGERFMSPLSEDRCVVLRVRAQVRHGVNPRAKLVEDFKIMPFVVEDEGGKLLVEAEHALLDIAPVKQPRSAASRKNQLLADLGHEDANPEKSDFEETIVAVGATVTIAGILQKQPEPRITGTKERPIAIKLERVSNLENEP
jgi:hypothetical protein